MNIVDHLPVTLTQGDYTSMVLIQKNAPNGLLALQPVLGFRMNLQKPINMASVLMGGDVDIVFEMVQLG